MKSNILQFVAVLISGIAAQNQHTAQDFVAILQEAFKNQQCNIQIQGEGGVIHGTHHDPNGDHIGGWLKYNGKAYQ